jgi:hypothetical protein
VDGVKKHKILEAVMKNNICTSDTWDKLISGSIPANKKIISAYGTEAAIILAELLSRYRYFEANGRLQSNNIFFNSRKDLKNGTGLGRYTQARVLSKLVKAGLLEVYYPKGKARRFKLDLQKINSLLDNNQVKNQPTINSDTDNPVDIQPTTRLKTNQLPGCNSATNNVFNNVLNNKESTPSAINEKDKKTSELQQAIGYFIKQFKDTVGKEPLITKGKDHQIIKNLITSYGLETTRKIIEVFFNQADDFIKERGYGINILQGQVNSILAKITKEEKNLRDEYDRGKERSVSSGQWFGESDSDFMERKRESKVIGIPSNIISHNSKAYCLCKKLALEEINNPGSVNRDKYDGGTCSAIDGILARYKENPEIKTILEETQDNPPLLQLTEQQIEEINKEIRRNQNKC